MLLNRKDGIRKDFFFRIEAAENYLAECLLRGNQVSPVLTDEQTHFYSFDKKLWVNLFFLLLFFVKFEEFATVVYNYL